MMMLSIIVKKPLIIREGDTIEKALKIIKKHKVWDLPVLDNKNKFKGIIHLQNILELILNKS